MSSVPTIVVHESGRDLSVEIKQLKQLVRRVTEESRRTARSLVIRLLILFRKQPVSVTGLVYPDGKTINIILRKTSNDASLEVEISQLASKRSRTKLELIAETQNWVQFFGHIPTDAENFDLRIYLGSRNVPIVDATNQQDGYGISGGASSWKPGARWVANVRTSSIRFNLDDDGNHNAVLGVIPGLGRLQIRLSRSVDATQIPSHITLRSRDGKHEIPIEMRSAGADLLCNIDALAVGRNLNQATSNSAVWDVLADGDRLRIGGTDISNPRSAYKYGWVKASSTNGSVKIRPYWTLNGYLSLEIKHTISAATQTAP